MNILIMSNSGFIVYKFRKELVEKLITDNHKVYISFPFEDKINESSSIDGLKKTGSILTDTKMQRRRISPLQDLLLLFRYIKLIKMIRADIVLTYTIKPNIYGGMACRMKRIPYISNVTGLGTAFQKGNLVKKAVAVLYKSVLKKAACAFFQNRENMDFFMQDKAAPRNFRLIPGSGVNLEYFRALEYPPDDVVRFVAITRILKEKGIDEYLEAAKYITGKYDNVEFHICGFLEDDYADIFKEYEKSGIIKYHGVIDDVREILAVTHCTVLPSHHEGMSNVLLESAACARPVIATDISGCREIVDDGINGFLVKTADSRDLIGKIEKFTGLSYSSKKNMGLEGRKKVEKEFDREIVIKEYREEIGKVLCQRAQ